MAQAHLIGLDWGTSSLRAYLFGADGSVAQAREADAGIQALAPGSYRESFESLCHDWLTRDPELPVIACGMIGSRQGWREASYAPTPAGFTELASAMLSMDDLAGRRFRVVPGVHTRSATGAHDVIRGEETQVIGVLSRLGLQHATVVLPGTHSKWVLVRDRRILAFGTYMTGELYGVLARHSILGRMFDETPGGRPPASEDRAFLDGLKRSADDPAGLSHHLFSVRAEALFNRYDGQALPAYLSGLLIGAEIAHARIHWLSDESQHNTGPILLVGSHALLERYAAALGIAGIAVTVVPDAPVADGLLALARAAGLVCG